MTLFGLDIAWVAETAKTPPPRALCHANTLPWFPVSSLRGLVASKFLNSFIARDDSFIARDDSRRMSCGSFSQRFRRADGLARQHETGCVAGSEC